MYTAKLLLEAEMDLAGACAWYEKERPGLGLRFLNEFDRRLETVKNNPFLFPVNFSEKYRFALLKKFPYSIAFRVDEEDVVIVTSVFHQHRNPSKF